MKTEAFLDLLQENSEKQLRFSYAPGKWVGANYHITEVKNIIIESVDCGARTDAWNETIVQLWESPSELKKTEFMTAYKALAIMKKVNRMRPMDLNSEIKFEYGNVEFHAAQLHVKSYVAGEHMVDIQLRTGKVDCKAKNECEAPALPQREEACCESGSTC